MDSCDLLLLLLYRLLIRVLGVPHTVGARVCRLPDVDPAQCKASFSTTQLSCQDGGIDRSETQYALNYHSLKLAQRDVLCL